LYTALLSNALDHATTRVTVDVDVDGRFAAVCVLDDGPGFAPDLAPRAFEPFVTAREAASGGHSGLGLGLAIVAEIVRRHHGQVRIQNAGERGAVLLRRPLAGARSPRLGWPQRLRWRPRTGR
jgi:two-component system, OmpR family, sensor kinase